MHQTWTALKHDGPNHLGLWLIRSRASTRPWPRTSLSGSWPVRGDTPPFSQRLTPFPALPLPPSQRLAPFLAPPPLPLSQRLTPFPCASAATQPNFPLRLRCHSAKDSRPSLCGAASVGVAAQGDERAAAGARRRHRCRPVALPAGRDGGGRDPAARCPPPPPPPPTWTIT